MCITYGTNIELSNFLAHHLSATSAEEQVKMTLTKDASDLSKWVIEAKDSEGNTIANMDGKPVKYGDLVGFKNVEILNWLSARGGDPAIAVPVCRGWEVFKIGGVVAVGTEVTEGNAVQLISEPFERADPSTAYLRWDTQGGETVICVANGHDHGAAWGLVEVSTTSVKASLEKSAAEA